MLLLSSSALAIFRQKNVLQRTGRHSIWAASDQGAGSTKNVGAASVWEAPRGDPEAAKELQRVLVFPDQVVPEDTPRAGEGDCQK